MGKTSLCIKMLQYLNTGRTYKVSELASLLETNPRNIIEYKKELDEVSLETGAGFYIETVPGRYGGYKINGNATVPSLMFTENERQALMDGLSYLSSRNDFMEKGEYELAMGKFLSSLITHDIEKSEKMTVINRYPLAMPQEEIQYRYDVMKAAIQRKLKVKFKYRAQKNAVKDHLFHPYELFMYNNAWFVIGWLEGSHPDVCWFKLNRLETVELTNEKFTVWKFYQKTDYIDDSGFKNNGKWYHVEFIAYDSYASLVRERIYGKNQVVEPIDERSTKVTVDMQNKENVIVFLMGFTKYIKIIGPKEIKDDIKAALAEMEKNNFD